ncbi:MAG: ABC-2 transporter permease, partial [Clostridia bacterium]|nr:ABC-2 transporter permease [Clostridia bacterium]
LYKDFVSVNRIGRIKLTWFMAGLTLIFIILRILAPGSLAGDELYAVTNTVESVNLIDITFAIFISILLIGCFCLINSFVGKMVDGDDKNSTRVYLASMPITKRTYIASKYVFVGVAAYVFMSICLIWSIAALAFAEEGYAQLVISFLELFIAPSFSIALLIAAFELPLFIILGKVRATNIKVGILLCLAIVVVGYFLFGDLSLLEKYFNIDVFVRFVSNHMDFVVMLQSMMPIIALVLFYVSYRITAHFYMKKEG